MSVNSLMKEAFRSTLLLFPLGAFCLFKVDWHTALECMVL